MPKILTAKVKNWASFQHYRDRSPPWIKLHRSFLDDYEFACLPLASKALAPMIWLLAAESVDGSVRADVEYLAFRLRWTEKDVDAGLSPLIERGFLVAASAVLAACEQHATPETETETETERRERETAPAVPAVASPRKPSSRGTRLPDDWAPSDAEMRWARDARPDLSAQAEVEKFRDHWHAKAGRDATKRDWSATWRNWVRNGYSHGAGVMAPARQRKMLGEGSSTNYGTPA